MSAWVPQIPRHLAVADGGSSTIITVLIAVFAVAICCAVSCAALNWLQARRKNADLASADASGSDVESSAHGPCVFEVVKVSNTVFKVQALEDAPAPEAVLPSEVGTTTSDSDADACEICYDTTARIVFLPCCHGGYCTGCADEILRRSNRHCVQCRGPVSNLGLPQRPLGASWGPLGSTPGPRSSTHNSLHVQLDFSAQATRSSI
eukprot:TRINITY_DN96166_c0_g1_i1.p1 TRINITY_DN96166_c0_g1~~TRINITY_DN96166_c0_g1_i1.p1  ORF type:complete len:206 (+),score=17.19 TRINITY_DN96166_c0_g1_i1:72-689(+)